MKNIVLSSPPKREIILEQEPLALNINVCLCFGLSSLLKMKGLRGEVKKFPRDMTDFTPESDGYTPGNRVSHFKMLSDSLTGPGRISILF